MNYCLSVIGFLTLSMVSAQAEFALRDGDKVVFLGDSITAAHNYSKIIEGYTLLRFPDRRIEFINVGQGGETAHGSLARLDESVFANKATVLTVAYGINDIGWGTKANDETKAAYLNGIRTIIERCREHGVRVFICSAAITAEAPDSAELGYLQTMCDEGLALARREGAGTIDVARSMREVQRRVWAANEKEVDAAKHTKLHVEDGVHLNDLGQMAMAWAILKGLGAPAAVSSLAIDATTGKIAKADACTAQDVALTAEGGSFVRLDDRLPLNLHSLWMLMGWHIPISSDLNEYRLQVSGLRDGRYTLTAGGRKLGEWGADALAEGINIASATGEPWEPGGVWDAQGRMVTRLTTARDLLDQTRAEMDQFLTAHPGQATLRTQLNAIEAQLVHLQRAAAKPVPVRFELQHLDP
ncbi:MAG: SGNH/GDSL hydrolase family protein [Verrucomicrobiales bacterium]